MKPEIDISIQKTSYPSPIEQVGLQDVYLPLQVQWGDEIQKVTAKTCVFVSLDDPSIRGIHMSRLYLSLYEFSRNKILSLNSLKELLDRCISAQNGLSSNGQIIISWKSFFQKKALQSSYTGWHVYPCFYEVIRSSKGVEQFLGGTIFYSSTCPCSAALSRSLMQEKFKIDGKTFSYAETLHWLGKESSMAGTPHSQRSTAQFKIKVSRDISFLSLIEKIEQALGTPVQTAVKREDEKQFAHLNSQNLMYSEDAVRKIKNALKNQNYIIHYWLKVRHMESLHPFDTVAVSTDGLSCQTDL